ncbi:MAG: hypothetical protein GX864_00965 [Mollicutes bacterium]|nr:hypothetical protein [Mollicutes bacterium]
MKNLIKLLSIFTIMFIALGCGKKNQTYKLGDYLEFQVQEKYTVIERENGTFNIDLNESSNLSIAVATFDYEVTNTVRKNEYKIVAPNKIADYSIDGVQGFYVDFKGESIITEVPINDLKYIQVIFTSKDPDLRKSFLEKEVQDIIKTIKIK